MCQKALSTSPNKSEKEFVLKLYSDNNSNISKMKNDFPLHNATCFKYRAIDNRKCWFHFFNPCINKRRITDLRFINIF